MKMKFIAFSFGVAAGLQVFAEVSVKSDHCMAQRNKLLQEYQLSSFDKPNKEKDVEKRQN